MDEGKNSYVQIFLSPMVSKPRYVYLPHQLRYDMRARCMLLYGQFLLRLLLGRRINFVNTWCMVVMYLVDHGWNVLWDLTVCGSVTYLELIT